MCVLLCSHKLTRSSDLSAVPVAETTLPSYSRCYMQLCTPVHDSVLHNELIYNELNPSPDIVIKTGTWKLFTKITSGITLHSGIVIIILLWLSDRYVLQPELAPSGFLQSVLCFFIKTRQPAIFQNRVLLGLFPDNHVTHARSRRPPIPATARKPTDIIYRQYISKISTLQTYLLLCRNRRFLQASLTSMSVTSTTTVSNCSSETRKSPCWTSERSQIMILKWKSGAKSETRSLYQRSLELVYRRCFPLNARGRMHALETMITYHWKSESAKVHLNSRNLSEWDYRGATAYSWRTPCLSFLQTTSSAIHSIKHERDHWHSVDQARDYGDIHSKLRSCLNPD